MNTRLRELLRKQILSNEEYEELELMEEVVSVENLGWGGRYPNLIWYDVTLNDESRFDVYTKD